MQLEEFRAECRDWVETNCPPSMRIGSIHFEDAYDLYQTDDANAWRTAAAARGWTAPHWPTEYGGGGLDGAHVRVLQEEMSAIKALPPATGMGLIMIGPTLLEFGTDEQKQRHLPKIVSGEAQWCQGYSEPGAGSDLAGLQTRAVLEGDQFVINGQKIWTSGAQHANWMFALVRTDPAAPKHDGISFVLLPMDQPGVTVKPIKLISGSSPFCETFFDDAIASRDDLIGELNKGWTVGKRLLQHERSGGGGPKKKAAVNPLVALAKDYYGTEANGTLDEPAVRNDITAQIMQEQAFALTTKRVIQESKAGGAPGAATSIFKLVGSTLAKDGSQLRSTLRGTQGLGWDGAGFTDTELESTRSWLRDRAVTIYGGTNEVQKNIIAKRVLGLPD